LYERRLREVQLESGNPMFPFERRAWLGRVADRTIFSAFQRTSRAQVHKAWPTMMAGGEGLRKVLTSLSGQDASQRLQEERKGATSGRPMPSRTGEGTTRLVRWDGSPHYEEHPP
jgi:hypothetical protein